MADGGATGRGLLKAGCIGCTVVVGLFVAVASVVVGLAYFRAQSENVEERRLEPGLPAPAESGPLEAADVEPGKLVIDVGAVEFELLPAAPGERLHVESSFDANAYELVENYRPTAGEIGGWVYEVSLHPRGSQLITLVKRMFSHNDPKLSVYVPRDLPLELEARARAGGGELSLGGLWIRSMELDASQGGYTVRVEEPLVEPMESLTVRARMGGFVLQRLGNASPRHIVFDARMGGGLLDLRGDWANDCEISLSWRRGGLSVELPRKAGVRGPDEGSLAEFVREAAEGEPTLTLTLDGKLDDIQFAR